MYSLVKMSSGWFCSKISDIEDGLENIQTHVDSGEPVVLIDDLDYFCDQFKVDSGDIAMVEPE